MSRNARASMWDLLVAIHGEFKVSMLFDASWRRAAIELIGSRLYGRGRAERGRDACHRVGRSSERGRSVGDSIRQTGLVANILSRVHIHATRLGAAQEVAHLPHPVDGSGFATEQARQSMRHTRKTFDSGVTDHYTGGPTRKIFDVLAERKYESLWGPYFNELFTRHNPGGAKELLVDHDSDLGDIKAKGTSNKRFEAFLDGLREACVSSLLTACQGASEKKDELREWQRLNEPLLLDLDSNAATKRAEGATRRERHKHLIETAEPGTKGSNMRKQQRVSSATPSRRTFAFRTRKSRTFGSSPKGVSRAFAEAMGRQSTYDDEQGPSLLDDDALEKAASGRGRVRQAPVSIAHARPIITLGISPDQQPLSATIIESSFFVSALNLAITKEVAGIKRGYLFSRSACPSAGFFYPRALFRLARPQHVDMEILVLNRPGKPLLVTTSPAASCSDPGSNNGVGGSFPTWNPASRK
ncbi:MAG: hypothetical protein M1816_004585 [Peltula sp. TS41687]|nr:MAG: hypothetical protein M1816_004585 [Peltula sp. TS41687]